MQSVELLRELTHTAAIEKKRLGISDLFWINEIEDNAEVIVLWDVVQHVNKNNKVIDVFAYNMLYNQMQNRFKSDPVDLIPKFDYIGRTVVVKYETNRDEDLKHHFKEAFFSVSNKYNGIERQQHAFHYTFCDVYMKPEEQRGVNVFEFEDVLTKFDVYIAEADRCSKLPTSTRFDEKDGSDKLGALVICEQNMCVYTYRPRTFSGIHLVQRREVILEESYQRWLRDNAQRLRNGQYVLINNNYLNNNY